MSQSDTFTLHFTLCTLHLYMVGVVQLAEHRIVVPGVVGSSPITHPIKSKDTFWYPCFLFCNGTRRTKCNADERCRRRLDGAEPFFSPKAKKQRVPLPTAIVLTHPAGREACLSCGFLLRFPASSLPAMRLRRSAAGGQWPPLHFCLDLCVPGAIKIDFLQTVCIIST